MTDVEYQKTRRDATVVEIELAGGSYAELVELLASRRRLARIYAEDGAHRTAAIIASVDIPLIEDAIRLLSAQKVGTR